MAYTRYSIYAVARKNRPKFCMFVAPNFLVGVPEFLDLRHKIQPVPDHAAKFHDDRPRELGDMVAKLTRKPSKADKPAR